MIKDTSKRIEQLKWFYANADEDKRLNANRQGQLEYITTMKFIHDYAKAGDKILEIGAGTGRYSIALAKEGYNVTAVELLENNLKVLCKNSANIENITSFQGDALDLPGFSDEEFDVTLVMGPMYHLYESRHVHRAIDEAIRVTKPGGAIFFAFLSIYAIMATNYLKGNFSGGLKGNFTSEYKVKHFEEQLFTGYDICEFEELFADKDVEYVTTAATDWILEVAEGREDFAIPDCDMADFTEYHLATCEKRELLGSSSHLLYICRKNT